MSQGCIWRLESEFIPIIYKADTNRHVLGVYLNIKIRIDPDSLKQNDNTYMTYKDQNLNSNVYTNKC